MTLNLAETSVVKSRLSVQHRANLFCLLILSFLRIYFLTHLLPDLSTPSRIGRYISRPEVVGGTKPGFKFVVLIPCCSIFCYGCMFAFVVSNLVFQ